MDAVGEGELAKFVFRSQPMSELEKSMDFSAYEDQQEQATTQTQPVIYPDSDQEGFGSQADPQP